jgi:type II secretory pathway pseudopilin PulG
MRSRSIHRRDSRLGNPVQARAKTAAWTLIEMIGVLAVLAVFAAVIVPVLVREVDRRSREAETTQMTRLAAALQGGIQRHREVPDENGYVQLIAEELGTKTDDVLTNSRGIRRGYLIDPQLRLGPTTNSTLPYRQTTEGSVPPISPRLILLSSLGESLPAAVTGGVAANDAAFDAVWSAEPGRIPDGWSWSGQGEDLILQRLQLAPLFIPVVLNSPSPSAPGKFGLDATGTNALGADVFTAWFLRGTTLRLHAADDTLQLVEVMQTPSAYGYERGAWRGQLSLDQEARPWRGAAVADAAASFLTAPWNGQAKDQITQHQVLAGMSDYLTAYLNWAARGFSYQPEVIGPVRAAGEVLGSVTADLLFQP